MEKSCEKMFYNTCPRSYEPGKRKTFDKSDPPCGVTGVDIDTGETKEIECYDVKYVPGRKRGLAIIMTNDFVDKSRITNKMDTPPKPLPFVEKDGQKLWNMFLDLKFDVIWHANYDASAMLDNLRGDVLKADDVGKMIVCCISTHGQQSMVLGQDGGKVWIKELVDKLSSVDDPQIEEKLLGKPKLFFIDACQGQYLEPAISDDTTVIKFDITQDFSRIAEHADILLGFAAYQGTASIGDQDGSYYTNELVKYLLKYHQTQDILEILDTVCMAVQSILPNLSESDRAQLPMVFSTLRKKLIMN